MSKVLKKTRHSDGQYNNQFSLTSALSFAIVIILGLTVFVQMANAEYKGK